MRQLHGRNLVIVPCDGLEIGYFLEAAAGARARVLPIVIGEYELANGADYFLNAPRADYPHWRQRRVVGMLQNQKG